MATCKQCNRPIEGSKRDHVCDMVIIQNKETKATLTVHASRVETGGDLSDEVGRDGKFEVVYRNRGKIEKLFEKLFEKEQKEKS